VRDALSKLNPEERMILSLHAEGYKNNEIATIMQEKHEEIADLMKKEGYINTRIELWTEPYTKIRLQRAKQKLRGFFDSL
jgi:hypothetical protein